MVDGAEDGAAGLRLALAESYDLVVLDLLLPRLDGLRLLTELRQLGDDVPVLILSARSDLPTKLRSFDLGANDYLAKPFSFDELVARVRVHLRRARDADPTTIRVGDLELDVARRQALSDGLAIDLSDREFRLLYHLVFHAARWSAGSASSRRSGATASIRARTSSTSASVGCARSSAPPGRSRRCGMPATGLQSPR